MPYTHRENVLHHAENAPEDTDFSHAKVYDLHDQPAAHKTEHIMSAITELKPGGPLSAHYPGPTVGYVIEGEFEGEDHSKPGEKFTVRKGDVLHFERDTHITWKTSHTAKALLVTHVPTTFQSVSDVVVRK